MLALPSKYTNVYLFRRRIIPGKQLYSRRFYLYEAFTSAVTLAVNCVGSIKRDRASVVSSLPTFDIPLKPNFSRNKTEKYLHRVLIFKDVIANILSHLN